MACGYASMADRLIILGTGGSALDVLDVVEAINARQRRWEVEGFLCDARAAGEEHAGYPVLGRLADAGRFEGRWLVNSIGSDKSFRQRPTVVGSCGLASDRFATLVHPGAGVSSRARLGRGVVVNFGASIGGYVRIGDHVYVSPGVIVGHDSDIGDYAVLAPGCIVSGQVRVGRASYIGAGAVVRQRLEIGGGALVGMGAVVVKDVGADTTVAGNPAHALYGPATPRATISGQG